MADVSITALPLVATATITGSEVDGVIVNASALAATASMTQVVHTVFPPAPINPALDQTLYPLPFEMTGTITGTWFNVTIAASALTATGTIAGSPVFGTVWSSSSTMTATAKLTDVDAVFGVTKKNWVKWSNIGHLDFTVWKDNIAGERPLDFNGWVYQLRKLHNRVIAYGQNGVTALLPAGNTYGMQTVFQLGLKGKHAVCGTDTEHFFVDIEGRLWRLAESMEKLDYAEYLAPMSSSMVLSLDRETGLVYICDGEYGYIYSPRSKSLGAGPNNITGAGNRSGTSYITASQTISTPVLNLTTDILDFGTRKAKTVRTVEIGTDTTQDLSVSLDYRIDKTADWLTTPWSTVTKEGTAYVPCYGVEFRINIKNTAYDNIGIDYITVNGEQHDY
jgi:hypothetical protein